jgi:hypothetical protein
MLGNGCASASEFDRPSISLCGCVPVSHVGSIAANFHEGTRSEYLAQYIFSGFGTSVPVPHPEDHGFDLFATLTERKGRRSWPSYHYTVQVKSRRQSWVFASADSVRWLLDLPHPLFLCILNKRDLRFSLYHSFPRFIVSTFRKNPTRLVFRPGLPGINQNTYSFEWPADDMTFNLGAPILDMELSELASKEGSGAARDIIASWLAFETDNLARIRTGIPIVEMPAAYWTNAPANASGGGAAYWNTSTDDLRRFKPVLGEVLAWFAENRRTHGELGDAALCALLLHRLKRAFHPNIGEAIHTELKLREMLDPKTPLVSAGVNFLNERFEAALGELAALRSATVIQTAAPASAPSSA